MRLKTYVLHETVDSAMHFAVVGTVGKFAQNRHVRKCWRFCQEHHLKAWLVLLDYEGGPRPAAGRVRLPSRIWQRLGDVPEKIDVVIPCLMPRHIPDIVEESVRAGAHTIWFQEKNWTPEFQEQAGAQGLNVVRGCILKHQKYQGPGKFLRPCYWHGLGSAKILPKYR